MCNREVKFGGFLKWALEHGADYVATGHYAQNKNNTLVQGADATKDQSYFLWTLTNEQLSHVLFPVGGFQKSEVRILAKKYQLPTAVKKDSQGICFIGEVDMKEFLSHYIPKQSGDVLDMSGNCIGHHTGALFFTLGERHGFEITKKGVDDKPLYVVAKDIAKNTITVSSNPKQETFGSKQIMLVDTVWRVPLEMNKKYTAQIRYHGELKPCCFIQNTEIVFDEPDYSLAPGQSIVVYDGNVCIGGGIVK
jgi:tRNA-specific 2-thiouridylase